mgnify:CR=1 FL=1
MTKGKDIRGKGKKKSGGRRKLIKKLKSDAAVFLNSEEGKMIKKDIVRTAIALGLVASSAALDSAHAGHVNSHADQPAIDNAHSDAVTHILHNDGATSGHSSGAHADTAHQNFLHSDSHTNGHANHSNHGSHGSGGWC